MANTLAVLPDFSNLHQRSDGEGRTSGLLTSSLQSVEEVDEGFDGGNGESFLICNCRGVAGLHPPLYQCCRLLCWLGLNGSDFELVM